jgi:integrase
MRRGELLGLKWSDIDFDRQRVSIERTVHHESVIQRDGSRRRKFVEAAPKTSSSRRFNQLTKPILEVLRLHSVRQGFERSEAGEHWTEGDFVFTSARGEPIDESNFYKRYMRFLRVNELRHVRFHDLRHSFATIAIEDDSGKVASVSRALGHSSIAITMDTYAKTARIATDATSRMSEIFFPEYGEIAPIEVPVPARSAASRPRNRHAS